MTAAKLTWVQKLNKEQQPKTEKLDKKLREKWGGETMFIATPKMVQELVAQIPKGKVTTVNLIREKLAGQNGTDITCPITTGIFLWIVANAMEEMRAAGAKKIVPYWRVLKEGGKLNEKFPGGLETHAAKLQDEGFLIVNNRAGKKTYVADYEKKLFRF
ncbi:MAG: MGMT family protein [Chitinophagales bacterium]